MNDVNSFDNHKTNIKEMIADLKDKNHSLKKKYKEYAKLTS